MSEATASRRLSRTESQQRTRALIIDAATRLFLRQGFRSTSLEQVADEAGFTIGAVYSNFEGKTAMGIAVVDGLYARAEQRLTDALAEIRRGDQEALFAALGAWAERVIGDPEWMRLETEVAAFSAHQPAYRAATAARYARLREWSVQHLDGWKQGLDPETLAAAIVGLALGIGAQRATDPSIPSSAWTDAVRRLMGATA